MPVIAITGSLCVGKTTVLKILKEKGARVFNVDRKIHSYYKDKTSIVYKKIKIIFPRVFDDKGNILRKKLGEIVFYDYDMLKKLEKIVHPRLIRDLRRWVQYRKGKPDIFVAEVPLLFERKLDKMFDEVILVYTPRSILLNRVKTKFGLSKKEALKRLNLFSSLNKKKKYSDFVINNNSNIYDLKRMVSQIWQELKRG